MKLGLCNRLPRLARWCARNARSDDAICGCTLTPCKPPVEFRSTLNRSAPICSRFRLTRFTRRLRDRFEKEIAESVDEIVFNGSREQRLPHLSNISFRFIEGEGLLIHLDMQGVAVSSGSACSSGTLEPSPVILALGRDDELARGSIRFSFGKDNSEEDVDYVLDVLT